MTETTRKVYTAEQLDRLVAHGGSGLVLTDVLTFAAAQARAIEKLKAELVRARAEELERSDRDDWSKGLAFGVGQSLRWLDGFLAEEGLS